MITPDPLACESNPIVLDVLEDGTSLRVTTTEFFRLSPTMEDVENRRAGSSIRASVTERVSLESWQGTRTLGIFPLESG